MKGLRIEGNKKVRMVMLEAMEMRREVIKVAGESEMESVRD